MQEQMIEPAIKGTWNVMNAAADAAVRRVVFTSSIGAVYMNPNRGLDAAVDESCWSDLDYCKVTEVHHQFIPAIWNDLSNNLLSSTTWWWRWMQNWYCYAKTVAEQVAWKVAGERRLDLVVVNPVLTLGPLLQPTLNASTAHVLKYLTGSAATYVNAAQAYVDVRDAAEAHIRVYEAPEAEGRYICAESTLHRGEVVRILAKLFPEYPIPTR